MKKNKIPKKRNSSLLSEMNIGVNKMNYKNLKRNCVARGMPFIEVIGATIPTLQNWLHDNYHKPISTELLNEYDEFIENNLREAGAGDIIYNQLRLGYIGDRSEDEEVLKLRVKKEKRVRVKKERDDNGVKGTKKHLTYKLTKEGLSLTKIVGKVRKEFGEINEKSIKIWYNRAKKQEREK